MNTEQLIEAVRNLLEVKQVKNLCVCDVCGSGNSTRGRFVADEFHCEPCIRTHAQLVLDHAESCRADVR